MQRIINARYQQPGCNGTMQSLLSNAACRGGLIDYRTEVKADELSTGANLSLGAPVHDFATVRPPGADPGSCPTSACAACAQLQSSSPESGQLICHSRIPTTAEQCTFGRSSSTAGVWGAWTAPATAAWRCPPWPPCLRPGKRCQSQSPWMLWSRPWAGPTMVGAGTSRAWHQSRSC